MSTSNKHQIAESNQESNDKYYDLILFVSELSPKNDFSFYYIDGYVSFEDLSYDCVKFFLNRFKNFDIFPANLYAMKDNVYKFHFDVNSIYESNFTNKIKEELPINKCSNRTLEILNCVQFIIDIFRGLHCVIIARGDSIELSELDQHNLQRFVSKMREIQLKPKKINFSSQFLFFHLIFDVDDLVRFVEEDWRLLELYDSKIIKAPFKNVAAVGGIAVTAAAAAEVSRCESAISTDEFPTSIESINDDRLLLGRLGLAPDPIPAGRDKAARKKGPKRLLRRPTALGATKSAADKYAGSNIDNDSLLRCGGGDGSDASDATGACDVTGGTGTGHGPIGPAAAPPTGKKSPRKKRNAIAVAAVVAKERKVSKAAPRNADCGKRSERLKKKSAAALLDGEPTASTAIGGHRMTAVRVMLDKSLPAAPPIGGAQPTDIDATAVAVVEPAASAPPIKQEATNGSVSDIIANTDGADDPVDYYINKIDRINAIAAAASGHISQNSIDDIINDVIVKPPTAAASATRTDESMRLIFSSCTSTSGLIYASNGVGAVNRRKRKANIKMKKNDFI